MAVHRQLSAQVIGVHGENSTYLNCLPCLEASPHLCCLQSPIETRQHIVRLSFNQRSRRKLTLESSRSNHVFLDLRLRVMKSATTLFASGDWKEKDMFSLEVAEPRSRICWPFWDEGQWKQCQLCFSKYAKGQLTFSLSS